MGILIYQSTDMGQIESNSLLQSLDEHTMDPAVFKHSISMHCPTEFVADPLRLAARKLQNASIPGLESVLYDVFNSTLPRFIENENGKPVVDALLTSSHFFSDAVLYDSKGKGLSAVFRPKHLVQTGQRGTSAKAFFMRFIIEKVIKLCKSS